MVFGILVVACRITIKEEKMWSSCMAPQGHNNCPSSLLSHSQNGAYKQQNREFGLFVNSIPLSTGKSFKNPNFLNNFNNHCHIIDKIKEKCPEVIPNFTEVTSEVHRQPKFTSSISSMCLNSDNNLMLKKQRKRELHKGRKHMHAGKKSKKISQKKEIKELMQIDSSQDLANQSMDVTFSPNPRNEPHNFILEDFMTKNPFKAHPPLKKTDPIHIPISKGAEMFVIISPSPNNKSNTQFSFTDSEDSFIVFEDSDEDSEQETEVETKEESLINNKKVQRNRHPSVCESEDSFIVFDRGDEETEDDTSYLSSSEEETSSEDEDEVSEVDEVDCSAAVSSHSLINRTRDRKKVRFVPDEKLCEVHSMVKWSYAYQAARKGPWEMYARDRCRFKDRIFRVERDIKQIFNRKHRERIFKERFENLIN